jgi:hypothetical protein
MEVTIFNFKIKVVHRFIGWLRLFEQRRIVLHRVVN